MSGKEKKGIFKTPQRGEFFVEASPNASVCKTPGWLPLMN